jgi:hypothetical protein
VASRGPNRAASSAAHRVLRLGLTALLVVTALAPIALPTEGASPAQVTTADEWPILGGRFFTQGRGEAPSGQGYGVVDDAEAPFWSEFQRLGGEHGVGYPISRRFVWDGFLCQAFQKAVFQWRPETGRVAYVNVLDELSARGRDNWLAVERSVPRPAPLGELNRPPEDVYFYRLGLLDADPAIRAAFYATEDWLDLYGLPAAPIADYGSVKVLRAQRVVIQHWQVDTPWAAAGQVLFANGGDLAKEAGLIPPEAAAPESPLADLPPLPPAPPTRS